jgi:competence ComEA-like helix-hairpin-helix protein
MPTTPLPSESGSRPGDGAAGPDGQAQRPRGRPWRLIGRDQALLYAAVLLFLAALAVRYGIGRGWGGAGVRGLEHGDPVEYRVDLNRASVAELDLLPGIGPSKAAAIIEYREANGGFGSVAEVSRVRGISPRLTEELRPLVTVGDAAGNGAERE